MIPSPWVGLVLVLAAYRCTRLTGWDDFPPIVRARAWVVGEKVVTRGSTNARLRQTSEKVERDTTYRWPTLNQFLHCAFCSGWWWSLAVYLSWIFAPRPTLYACAPLAFSAAVGLVAKNLDP